MAIGTYTMRKKVWLYPGEAAWYFVNLTKQASDEIKDTFGQQAGGFGSVRVEVTVGETSWKTSIFPDSESGTYLLPLKADVRKKEGIEEGKLLELTVQVLP